MIRSTKRLLHGGRSKPHHQAPFRRSPQDEGGRTWIDPYRNAVRKELILCHYCGYSPSKIPADGMCPKCGKGAWERSVVSLRLVPVQDEE
jgi:rubrerythrin